MTNPYRSQEVDYIKMTLKAKEDGSTKTFYLSDKFYPPESVYGFRAGYLDGNDYWNKTDAASISAGNIDFSFACWFKVDATGASVQNIAGKGDFSSANQTEWRVTIAGNTLGVTLENGAASQSIYHSKIIAPNIWYFVAFWHDAANDEVGIVLNEDIEITSYSAGSFDSTGPLTFGKEPNDASDYFTGYICNAGFWKKVLSLDELSALYNSGAGLSYAELTSDLTDQLQSYWECDEAEGAASKADSVGSNSLTISGGAAVGNGPGNFRIYPALVNLPQIGFALGPVSSEQIDTQVACWAFSSLGNNNQTLASLLKAYEISGQPLEIYYISKAHDEYVQNDASFPSLRQTLEMLSYDLNEDDGILTIQCHDRWFKDTIAQKQASVEDFALMAESDYGLPQAFVWGQRNSDTDGFSDRYGPIVPTVWVDVVTDNPVSGNTYAQGKLLYAATPNDFDIYGFQDDYIYNKDDPGVGAQPWHKVTWPVAASAPAAASVFALDGPSNTTLTDTSNALSLVTYPVIARAWSASTAYVSSGFRIELRDLNNSIVDADGPVRVSLHYAEIRDTNNLFLLNELRTKLITGGDSRISGTAAVLTELWDEPCVLLPDITYALCVRWLRDDAAGGTDIMQMFYSNSGSDVLYVESFGNDQFLTKAAGAVGLQLAVDVIYRTTADSDTGGASQEYASRTLFANYSSGNSGAVPFDSLTIQSYLKGYKDFTPKVHTATAGNIIKYPSEVISSILNAPSVCELADVGHFNHDVDSIVDAYGAHVGEQTLINIAQAGNFSAQELILQICEISRVRFIKERNGKLSAKFPANYDAGAATVLSESEHRSDLSVVALSETDPNQIVNDFRGIYRREYLEGKKDAKTAAIIGSNQFGSIFKLNGDDSTDSDTVREAILAESISTYGAKDWRREISFFDYTEPVRRLVDYLADRYAFRQKRATVRVLKREFYSLFLRDQVELLHTKFSGANDFAENYVRDWDRLKVIDEDYLGVNFTGGASVAVYLDGVPQPLMALGSLGGEIVAIQEQGPYLFLTIETMAKFLEVTFTEGSYE